MEFSISPDTLESAACQAWPALEEEQLRGWTLRFANGYTKRANSANPTGAAGDLSPAEIAHIEGRYRARGLVPTFRLVDAMRSAVVDALLDERGYRLVDPSLVMVRPLERGAPEVFLDLVEDPAAWLQGFGRITGMASNVDGRHLQILRAISGPRAMAVLRQPAGTAGDPICCGLGVVVRRLVGLFDVATAPDFRGRGLATRLCEGLMGWGLSRDAEAAYLQVSSSNVAAISVYERLGFRRAYAYWYRVLR